MARGNLVSVLFLEIAKKVSVLKLAKAKKRTDTKLTKLPYKSSPSASANASS